MDGNKPLSPIPLPGIALALLMIGVIVFSDNPFKPTRPGSGADITSTAEDVRARLWQDPFDAVETHIKSVHSAKSPKDKQITPSNFNATITLTPKSAAGNQGIASHFDATISLTPESPKEKQIITPNHNASIVLDNHRICRFKGAFDDPNSEDNPLLTTAHSIEELRCQIQRDVKNEPGEPARIHVLAVMVPGGPYAEEHEARIRSRYAVITGLSQSGYIPKDAEHIGYLNLGNSCRGRSGEYCSKSGLIPYEWFVANRQSIRKKKKNYSDRVLVAWLDDAEFSQSTPLANLDRFKNALTPGPHEKYFSKTGADISESNPHQKKSGLKDSELKELVQVKFDVIGPAGSTTLVKMFKEALNKDGGGNGKNVCDQDTDAGNDCIRIISPRATIDYDAISQIIYGSSDPTVSSADLGRYNSDGQANNGNKTSLNRFKLIRTIPTDAMLVDELLCQLLYRGFNPYQKGMSSILLNQRICPDKVDRVLATNKYGKKGRILLIGEWDTAYSRNYKKLFRDKLKGINEETSWFYSSNYLRGIDGIIGPEGTKNTTEETKQDGKKVFRRPVGPNQFDYLRRLGDDLTRFSNSLKASESIRAIGIVGSDTYDKLLILQALRNRFPAAIFFTTDLDARLLHPEENKWARNLVVATGFGFTPPPEFKNRASDEERDEEILPFRDGYQTATYISIYKATQQNAQFGSPSNTYAFEIGNNSVVDYSAGKLEKESKEKEDNDGNTQDTGMPDDGLDDQNKTDGLSSLIKKYLIQPVLLPIILILFLMYQSSKGNASIIVVFAAMSGIIYLWLLYFNATNSLEFKAMFSGTSIWPAMLMRMLAAVIAFFSIFYALLRLRKNTLDIIETHELPFHNYQELGERIFMRLQSVTAAYKGIGFFVAGIYHELVTSLKWMLHFKYIDNGAIREKGYETPGILAHLFIPLWGSRYKANKKITIDELMYQYLDMGRTKWWFTRVVLMFLFYYWIVKIIFLFSSGSATFFTGNASQAAASGIIFVTVKAYYFLVFLIVDITRLNAQFVELLTNCKVIWPESVTARYCRDYGITHQVAYEKLKLDLIVQRSKAVDVLIFLPFIIISLLILSRSEFFDHWHTSLMLMIVILLGALIALSSAFRLRRTAAKARSHVLDKLDQVLRHHQYKECIQEMSKGDAAVSSHKNDIEKIEHKMTERLKVIIEDIKNIKAGPFLPIARHPIISAIAMPFGGVGGLYLIDYLTNAGV